MIFKSILRSFYISNPSSNQLWFRMVS